MLTTDQKLKNEEFFNQVINVTKDGGYYTWSSTGDTCVVKDGKLHANVLGINRISSIVTQKFHDKLVIVK